MHWQASMTFPCIHYQLNSYQPIYQKG
jgi:hypothetical protein